MLYQYSPPADLRPLAASSRALVKETVMEKLKAGSWRPLPFLGLLAFVGFPLGAP